MTGDDLGWLFGKGSMEDVSVHNRYREATRPWSKRSQRLPEHATVPGSYVVSAFPGT